MARTSSKPATPPPAADDARGLVFEAALNDGDFLKFGRDDQGVLTLQVPRAAALSVLERANEFADRTFFVAFLHRRPV
jgi:hypothetical protein